MVEKIIKLSEYFGSTCAEGDKGVDFLLNTVRPVVEEGNQIIFDFSNIRTMNSSFANALFGNLYAFYPNCFKLKNVKPDLPVVLVSAFEYGKKVRSNYEAEHKSYSCWDFCKRFLGK